MRNKCDEDWGQLPSFAWGQEFTLSHWAFPCPVRDIPGLLVLRFAGTSKRPSVSRANSLHLTVNKLRLFAFTTFLLTKSIQCLSLAFIEAMIQFNFILLASTGSTSWCCPSLHHLSQSHSTLWRWISLPDSFHDVCQESDLELWKACIHPQANAHLLKGERAHLVPVNSFSSYAVLSQLDSSSVISFSLTPRCRLLRTNWWPTEHRIAITSHDSYKWEVLFPILWSYFNHYYIASWHTLMLCN